MAIGWHLNATTIRSLGIPLWGYLVGRVSSHTLRFVRERQTLRAPGSFMSRNIIRPARMPPNTIDCNCIDPASLASQSFRPWEAASYPTQSAHRERSRGFGKGARQVSGKESIHGLKVLDQVPAKIGTGGPWPRQITFSVGDHGVFSI